MASKLQRSITRKIYSARKTHKRTANGEVKENMFLVGKALRVTAWHEIDIFIILRF